MKLKKGRDAKPHIGIFGRRNVGKSSFINRLVGQDVAIVSEHPGTTTDPVKKSLEIFGIGPAIIIDTAGIDDIGDLGQKRIEKSEEMIRIIDLAILIISENAFGDFEIDLIEKFRQWDIPYIIIHNKSDETALSNDTRKKVKWICNKEILTFSAYADEDLEPVINHMKLTIPDSIFQRKSLLASILNKNDHVLLVTPIDKEAPEGRMILPQVMAIRDVLDNECINIVLRETQLESYLENCNVKPRLVITDSQAFDFVKEIVPDDIALTGFSVLFASFKGEFDHYLRGTPKIDQLKDGDNVLLLESCTHQVNCDDIGRYKIPQWLKDHTNKDLHFDVVSGLNKLSRPIDDYALVIQCGGCMITKKQIGNRLKPAIEKGIPVSNYGMTIAWVNGIFERATAPFMQEEYV